MSVSSKREQVILSHRLPLLFWFLFRRVPHTWQTQYVIVYLWSLFTPHHSHTHSPTFVALFYIARCNCHLPSAPCPINRILLKMHSTFEIILIWFIMQYRPMAGTVLLPMQAYIIIATVECNWNQLNNHYSILGISIPTTVAADLTNCTCVSANLLHNKRKLTGTFHTVNNLLYYTDLIRSTKAYDKTLTIMSC